MRDRCNIKFARARDRLLAPQAASITPGARAVLSMSCSFVKLFASITDSSIWSENNETRILWVTMLAMSDQFGRIYAAVPGLAHRARLSIQETEIGLRRFLAPDPFSRCKDNDGRRIEEIDGGWRLLNYFHYRELRDQDVRREQNRLAKQRQRQKEKTMLKGHHDVSNCQQSQPRSAQVEVEAEAEYICVGCNGICTPTPSNSPPAADTTPQVSQNQKRNQDNNKFQNAPSLTQSFEYFNSTPGNFSRAEIKRAWQSFEACAVDGIWMWGKRPVTDWRHALECRINDSRDRNPNQDTSRKSDETIIKAIRAIRP